MERESMINLRQTFAKPQPDEPGVLICTIEDRGIKHVFRINNPQFRSALETAGVTIE